MKADIKNYTYGLVSALLLTLIAYVSVTSHLFTGDTLVLVIMLLASLQLIAQLVFFLHFGKKDRGGSSRWKNATFYFMLIVLVILVGGSLWIMSSLNYNMMMTPEQMNEYMLKQSSKGF